MRGDNRREIELADLYLLPLENEGPTKCNVLVGLLCLVWTGLGPVHARSTVHVDGEPFPVLRSNETWFRYGKWYYYW
ncbi:hypothetical protein V1509DRAFT_616771 [Lipomyces kononenkoae]